MTESASPLEQYLAAARRQWWVILQAVVIVAIVAAWFASREPEPPYRTTTSFLVRPEYDANGRLLASLDVTASAQARGLTSDAVLSAAATQVPGETAESIRSTMGVGTDARNGTITATFSAAQPDRLVPIANAVATAFVEDRRNERTAAVQARVDDYERQLAELEADITNLDQQIADATATGANTATLTARRETAITRYEEIFSRQQEALTQVQSADPGVQVLSPATGAAQGEKPSPLERGLIGAGIGLLIGIALAALRETLDSRLRTRAAVEDVSGLTVVAEFPEERIRTRRREVPVIDQPGGPLAESVRGLRTTLRYLGSSNPVRSVVVTSPQPGDGKTLTAANLAASYAASGISTVLVSADLRRPGLDDLFGVDGMVGLSDVLSGAWPGPPQRAQNPDGSGMGVLDPGVSPRNLEPLLRPTPLPNLYLMPAGRIPPNPAELLASERASKVFAVLGELAEMIVIDSPPTLVADGPLLAGMADGVVLVVALDRTRRAPLRAARQALDGANARVLGVVMNRVRSKQAGYSAYYSAKPGKKKRSTYRTRRLSAR